MRFDLYHVPLFLLIAFVCGAQSVRPAVVEYTNAGEGSFEVLNDSIAPLFVSIEAKSFTIDSEGTAHFVPLSPAIHLQLSQTSLRLPPLSRRTIFYQAKADTYPAWFCIYSNFAGTPRRDSVNISLELPHTVYLLSKSPIPVGSITFDHLRKEGSTLLGSVSNSGMNVVRLQALQIIDTNGRKREEGGFPLLPGGTRELRLPLRSDEQPERVRTKIGRAAAEGVLQ